MGPCSACSESLLWVLCHGPLFSFSLLCSRPNIIKTMINVTANKNKTMPNVEPGWSAEEAFFNAAVDAVESPQ